MYNVHLHVQGDVHCTWHACCVYISTRGAWCVLHCFLYLTTCVVFDHKWQCYVQSIGSTTVSPKWSPCVHHAVVISPEFPSYMSTRLWTCTCNGQTACVYLGSLNLFTLHSRTNFMCMCHNVDVLDHTCTCTVCIPHT